MLDGGRIERLKQEMEKFGSDRDAPVRVVMGLLGDRWTMLILNLLGVNSVRYGDLRRALIAAAPEPIISQRVLTLKLKALQREGIVAREVGTETPPCVYYSLTALGSDLQKEARLVIEWVLRNSEKINSSRAAYDRKNNLKSIEDGLGDI